MPEVKPSWIAGALLVAVALVFLLFKTTEKVAPVPVALWVAIQPEGEEVARSGRLELEAGTPFRLHAVLEAETFRGDRIFYTEAKQLELLGEPIPAERLEPWGRRLEARVLWFAVEGSVPFRELREGSALEMPRFEEIFRADWGQAWTVAGDLRPTVENFLPGDEGERRSRRFGTQRFQVRIELFGADNQLVPRQRFASWGAGEVAARGADFPAVVAGLPASLGVPSRVFGLPQIEVAPDRMSPEIVERLAAWTEGLIAFSRISVLGVWLDAQGIAWEDLDWESVELGASGAQARPGDLLRVGRRLVWILEDRDAPGLDEGDLCLDFERGARVQRLGDVFVGEGLVEWARVPGARTGSGIVVQ